MIARFADAINPSRAELRKIADLEKIENKA
jgi:hypothetical protein